MARPKSEEKRLALLNATAELVAEDGLEATPTSKIAKKAEVAEGTLFRYFATKDELLNELYIHIKQDMCDALLTGYDNTQAFENRFKVLWENYIKWGLANPSLNKVVNQLTVSSVLTQETLDRANELFPETEVWERFANNPLFLGREDFAEAIFTAVAEATMSLAEREPSLAAKAMESGYKALLKMYGD